MTCKCHSDAVYDGLSDCPQCKHRSFDPFCFACERKQCGYSQTPPVVLCYFTHKSNNGNVNGVIELPDGRKLTHNSTTLEWLKKDLLREAIMRFPEYEVEWKDEETK